MLFGMRTGAKRMAKAASLRLQIVDMNASGMSNLAIAKQLGIHPRTVDRHLKRFLTVDSKYPPNVGPAEIDLMRSEQREALEWYARNLAKGVTDLDKEEKTFDQKVTYLETATKAAESYVKISDKLSALYGLDAPKQPAIVNNNMLNLSADTIALLNRYREIQSAKRLTLSQ
jgi:IS30 family transposase